MPPEICPYHEDVRKGIANLEKAVGVREYENGAQNKKIDDLEEGETSINEKLNTLIGQMNFVIIFIQAIIGLAVLGVIGGVTMKILNIG